MMHDLSRADRMHLAIAKDTKPAVSLIPKRCACGAACFAKQLAQHGKCAACVLADRVAALQPEDIEILRFALGATAHHAKTRWGFRNGYHCYRRDIPSIQRLLNAGFFTIAGSVGICQKFVATAAGCKLAGLSAARTRHAMQYQNGKEKVTVNL